VAGSCNFLTDAANFRQKRFWVLKVSNVFSKWKFLSQILHFLDKSVFVKKIFSQCFYSFPIAQNLGGGSCFFCCPSGLSPPWLRRTEFDTSQTMCVVTVCRRPMPSSAATSHCDDASVTAERQTPVNQPTIASASAAASVTSSHSSFSASQVPVWQIELVCVWPVACLHVTAATVFWSVAECYQRGW